MRSRHAPATRADVRLYLLGGSGDTARRAGVALQQRHPGAIVAGARDGYFTAADDAAVAAAIRASGANVLLAGLGFPKQELLAARNLAATGLRGRHRRRRLVRRLCRQRCARAGARAARGARVGVSPRQGAEALAATAARCRGSRSPRSPRR